MWTAIFIAAYLTYFTLDAIRVRRLRRRIDVLLDHKVRLRGLLIWLGMSIADLDTIAPWLGPDGKPLPPPDAATVEADATEVAPAIDVVEQVEQTEQVDQADQA